MVKLGAIEFDDSILDALRDEELVIFAGAGISIGPPSNLPGFGKLASDIAQGTGAVPTEPWDRFLGQLKHRKVAVHERAAQLLSPVDSAPNPLHFDLLRLFRTAERVRLVTTNFDLHFESAASTIFDKVPETYRAPALPLGYDFTGIVHVHGALPRERDLVLTDADFGRAYLTEGWARRFLVDVFRRYTVLFVGYSHTDVVMNYLARALPSEGIAGRFALTDETGNWELLGIKPIRFTKTTGPNVYSELYGGVQKLAERAIRGALHWQSRLAEIGGRPPPADEEAIAEVEHALRELHTTRFLTNVARDVDWPNWLNSRKQLDALFGTADLNERDKLLAGWLAEHFAIEYPDAIFELVVAHGLQLHPVFWWSIARELGDMKEKVLEEASLKRWVTILLASAPTRADHHALMWLAERCANQGAVSLALKVFFAMSEHRLNIKKGLVWFEAEETAGGRRLDVDCPLRADHWSLNEVWTKQLKPHIASIAQPLLSGITRCLEEMHHDLVAWDKASREWDPVSYGRSAIEAHEQDRYPEAVDVLVDAARDALEWLAANAPILLDAWMERLISSEIPLLRRLAIHAVTIHSGMSADECVSWLLRCTDLHGFAEHHEVHRAIALNYPRASDGVRKAVITAVLAHTLPASEDRPAEIRTARAHFDWLSWLLQSKPDCALAKSALTPITDQYQNWRPSDHPDLTHWSGSADWVGSQSPWSVVQLLAQDPDAQLDELLTFKGDSCGGPDREGLIATVREASMQRAQWGFALANALAARLLWKSDLWPAVIRGWQEAELTIDEWRVALRATAVPELQIAHPHEIANLLQSIVRDGGKPFAVDLVAQANSVAFGLWQILKPNEQDEDVDDWLSRAINRPAGVTVEFWINGLSLLMRGKTGADRTLPVNYRQWFTMVAEDPSSKGGLGRSLLAGQTAFLFGLDESWTRKHVIPLFSHSDAQKFAQAWDGFLLWGRLYPALVEALVPAFAGAFVRISGDVRGRRRRFVELYTALVVFHVTNPNERLLPALFEHGSVEDRVSFASRLGYFLRQIQEEAKKQLWERWLSHYWQDRLHAVPAALDEGEVRAMLEWLPHLGDSFPAAVALAIRFPRIRIERSHTLFELTASDLVTRYPNEVAELLIFLCECGVGFSAADLRTISHRLSALGPDLRLRLDEGLATVGANPAMQ
jgi:hypothetical protein